MKRKLLSVLLVLAMVLAILPVGAMAAENDPITKDGFTFGRAFVHGGLMVTGYENKDAAELTIPSEVDGQPVTELGGGCFMGFASLKSVTIPESVVHLWPNVFKDCTALTDVQFQGESVIVEGGDFDNCTSLEEITLPKQSMVANYMFDGCTNLKKVVISEGTRAIGTNLFRNCPNLKTLVIPASVDLIYRRGNDGYKGLTVVGLEKTYAEKFAQKMGYDFDVVTYPDTFKDVKAGRFYSGAVQWASQQEITTGYSDGTFRPDVACTRWQMVVFLWRLYGQPVADTIHEFTDVPKDAIYYDAVQWAYEEGITKGMSDSTFGPNVTVNRGMVVTMLWRLDGSKVDPMGDEIPFVDEIPLAYQPAVRWMSDKGVVLGFGDNTFRAKEPCTRGQIVTFMHRNMYYYYHGDEFGVEIIR